MYMYIHPKAHQYRLILYKQIDVCKKKEKKKRINTDILCIWCFSCIYMPMNHSKYKFMEVEREFLTITLQNHTKRIYY